MKSFPNVQPQATTQTLQNATAASAGVLTPVRTSMMSQFNWYHAVLAVGFLVSAGAGTVVLVKVIISHLHSIKLVVGDVNAYPSYFIPFFDGLLLWISFALLIYNSIL